MRINFVPLFLAWKLHGERSIYHLSLSLYSLFCGCAPVLQCRLGKFFTKIKMICDCQRNNFAEKICRMFLLRLLCLLILGLLSSCSTVQEASTISKGCHDSSQDLVLGSLAQPEDLLKETIETGFFISHSSFCPAKQMCLYCPKQYGGRLFFTIGSSAPNGNNGISTAAAGGQPNGAKVVYNHVVCAECVLAKNLLNLRCTACLQMCNYKNMASYIRYVATKDMRKTANYETVQSVACKFIGDLIYACGYYCFLYSLAIPDIGDLMKLSIFIQSLKVELQRAALDACRPDNEDDMNLSNSDAEIDDTNHCTDAKIARMNPVTDNAAEKSLAEFTKKTGISNKNRKPRDANNDMVVIIADDLRRIIKRIESQAAAEQAEEEMKLSQDMTINKPLKVKIDMPYFYIKSLKFPFPREYGDDLNEFADHLSYTQNISQFVCQHRLQYLLAQILYLLNDASVPARKTIPYLLPFVLSNNLTKNEFITLKVRDYRNRISSIEENQELILNCLISTNYNRWTKMCNFKALILEYLNHPEFSGARLLDFIEINLSHCTATSDIEKDNCLTTRNKKRKSFKVNDSLNRPLYMLRRIINAISKNCKAAIFNTSDITKLNNLISNNPDLSLQLEGLREMSNENSTGIPAQTYTAFKTEAVQNIELREFRPLNPVIEELAPRMTHRQMLRFAKGICSCCTDMNTRVFYLPELLKYGVINENNYSKLFDNTKYTRALPIAYFSAALSSIIEAFMAFEDSLPTAAGQIAKNGQNEPSAAGQMVMNGQSELSAAKMQLGPEICTIITCFYNAVEGFTRSFQFSLFKYLAITEDYYTIIGFIYFYNSYIKNYWQSDLGRYTIKFYSLTQVECLEIFKKLCRDYSGAETPRYRKILKAVIYNLYFHFLSCDYAHFFKDSLRYKMVRELIEARLDLASILESYLDPVEEHRKMLEKAYFEYQFGLERIKTRGTGDTVLSFFIPKGPSDATLLSINRLCKEYSAIFKSLKGGNGDTLAAVKMNFKKFVADLVLLDFEIPSAPEVFDTVIYPFVSNEVLNKYFKLAKCAEDRTDSQFAALIRLYPGDDER